ncbi:MAG TPA: GGDEF domain-containing protein [Xanthobacteraceae bacterium]|nr:GGDEF domain-containing protein [Xanthobacteraceae bacterium]
MPHDEHERTLAFAEIALGQIRALAQPATPRNFEIWYSYATGYNQTLNQTINETLSKKGVLSETDLEQIYDNYIGTNRLGDRMDTVNNRVLEEINQVISTIDAAAGSATSYSRRLNLASQELARANDGEALRTVIEHLVQGAKEMELNNKKLEASLASSRQEIEQLQQNLETVRLESQTDPLTTLANRKYFDNALTKGLTEAKERNQPFALLMADIDYFKGFNDQYGHLTGDQVLRLVALAIKQNVKGQDTAARYGGEEFVIALPNTTLQSAVTVAEHIRRAVMTKELMRRSNGERLGHVTISIGAAVVRPGDTTQLLIDRADRCLYAAKRQGRNRVIGESDPEAERPPIAPATRVA